MIIGRNVGIHYVTEEGGGQPNVVPGYARTWYYIRAPERDQVDEIYDQVSKEIDKNKDLLIDEIEKSLRQKEEKERLFLINWKIK